MSAFIAGALGLLAVAAGLLILRRPHIARPADDDDPNLAWLRSREQEIEGADPALVEEARLRLLEDGLKPAGDAHPGTRKRFPALALLAVLLLAVGGIYWKTGAMEDVLIYRALETISPEDGEAARVALLNRIAARSSARPENLQYHGLLGRLYMADEDFSSAQASFERLVELAPEDPQALALAAQARFLASGRRLDEVSQLYAERALAVDPQQRTALGMLGMASFEAEQYNAAVSYWERLQALESPGSPAHTMLEEVLDLARQRAGGESVAAASVRAADASAEAGAASEDSDAAGISVVLSLAAALEADPAAVVFVFARSTGSRGMPVAVRRVAAGELPLTLRLSDNDAMMGQRLSEAGEVIVTAQVSANGQPGEANALFTGAAGPVSAGGVDVSVSIELQPAGERS